MEIRIYDSSMNFLGIIENQTSFQWNRKYYDVGDFELHIPITTYNASLISLGNLVWVRKKKECGVIEDIKYTMNERKQECVVKGRFAESYMDRRLIRPRLTFSGTVENGMRQILTDATAIPNVVLGEALELTDTVTFQATYKNLLVYEKKLAQSAGYGFRFRPSFDNKTLTFEIYVGVDRSIQQTDRTKVEFSDRFENLNAITYQQNDQLLKSVGYVGGEGEYPDRTYVTVGDDTLTGLERREVFIDASDITLDDGMTTSEYNDLLTQRGNEVLAEDVKSESLDFDTDQNGNFVYLRDYDLGDIVTVKKDAWNLSANMRITEISEVYERGYAKITPTFGNPLPTTIDWSE